MDDSIASATHPFTWRGLIYLIYGKMPRRIVVLAFLAKASDWRKYSTVVCKRKKHSGIDFS